MFNPIHTSAFAKTTASLNQNDLYNDLATNFNTIKVNNYVPVVHLLTDALNRVPQRSVDSSLLSIFYSSTNVSEMNFTGDLMKYLFTECNHYQYKHFHCLIVNANQLQNNLQLYLAKCSRSRKHHPVSGYYPGEKMSLQLYPALQKKVNETHDRFLLLKRVAGKPTVVMEVPKALIILFLLRGQSLAQKAADTYLRSLMRNYLKRHHSLYFQMSLAV